MLSLLCHVIDSDDDTLNLALVQNTFTYEEHTVKIAPHGNSVKLESYVHTMPSALNKLKDVSLSNTAKGALSLVTNDITTIHLAGTMAHKRQQVNDICKKMTTTTNLLFMFKATTRHSIAYFCLQEPGHAI